MDEVVSNFSLFYAVIHVFRLNVKILLSHQSLCQFESVNNLPGIAAPSCSGISVLGCSAVDLDS